MPATSITPDDAIDLIQRGKVLLDVRAEAEFARGSFPNACNLPILLDAERKQVGICYKNQGQQAAIQLGHRLVHRQAKAERVASWQRCAQDAPGTALFCWRGGLRSKIAADWLRGAGTPMARVAGGYKAVRGRLLELLPQIVARLPLVLIGGKTGTGKTRILNKLARRVDLEGLARHRGSAFGAQIAPQPTPINFENNLILALLLPTQQNERLVLEDEGRTIGRLTLPAVLFQAMQRASMVVLTASLAERAEAIWAEYIIGGLRCYQAAYGDAGQRHFEGWLTGALLKIRKRLGGLNYQSIRQKMSDAFRQQRHDGDMGGHLLWITGILQNYYDPMYDYQLQQKNGRIIFQGSGEEVQDYLS